MTSGVTSLNNLVYLYFFRSMPSNVSKNCSSSDTVFGRSNTVSLPTISFRNLVFATMSIAVAASAQDGPFQARYASNLGIADSVINLSNDGSSMLAPSIQSGFTAAVPGSICVNVYTFAADEEFVSCCSCPVTPNGLVALSVQKDLINNPLTRVTGTSFMIKLLATNPAGTSCAGSAATANGNTLAFGGGMLAWMKSGVTAATPSGTAETPFQQGNLTTGELARLTTLCTFAIAQGTGTGICNSCELTGLGAASSNQ
jgi:hypothetical protein